MAGPNDNQDVNDIVNNPLVKFGKAVGGAQAGAAKVADKINTKASNVAKTVSNQPNSLRKRAKGLLSKVTG